MWEERVNGYTLIMLVLGIILALVILAIVFYSSNFGFLFENVKFIPVLGANIGILLVAYVKSHYTILRFISEKNFEVSSGKLSNYKSLFEFKGIIAKLKTSSKIATKNYIRSGKILASLLFSFFLAFSIISFALGPVSITETYSYQIDNRFSEITYVIGQDEIVDYFQLNLGAQTFTNTPYTKALNDIQYFNSLTLNNSLITELETSGVQIQEYFITKLKVQEIAVVWEQVDYDVVMLGYNRTGYATVLGCEDFPVSEDLFIWGEEPSNNGEIILGESLDNAIFEDSKYQELKITQNSVRYDVSGVIQDTFSAGFSVYMSMNKLMTELGAAGPNMITLGELNSTTLSIVTSIVESQGYSIESINELTKESKKDYLTFSAIYGILGGLLFLIFSFQIIIFSVLYVLSYRNDYELLYKLGVSRKKIAKISVRSILLQVIPGTVFGTYFGSIITRYFLVPYSKLSYYLIFLFGIMLWFIGVAYLGAILASRRQIKQVYDKIYKNKIMRY
ncbi:MAG: hypothetical protein ACTSQF_02230 [Candidatus Heimdallarchaeaceae archaeon]